MTDQNQPPAYLNRNTGGAIDDISRGLGTSAPPYISIKGNRFTLVDAGGNKLNVPTFDPKIGPYLDVVIIAGNMHTSQVYYAGDFDPSATEFAPPDCWSDNGVGPSVNAMHPQSQTCEACPKREWGSDVSKLTGRGVPACGAYKKMAVLLADESCGPAASQLVYLLRVPPASAKALRTYVQNVAKHQIFNRPLDTTDIVTRIYFNAGPNHNQQGILGFGSIDYIDEGTAELVGNALQEKASLDLLLGRNDRPRTTPLAAPIGHRVGDERMMNPAPTPAQIQGGVGGAFVASQPGGAFPNPSQVVSAPASTAFAPPQQDPAPAPAKKKRGPKPKNPPQDGAPVQGNPLPQNGTGGAAFAMPQGSPPVQANATAPFARPAPQTQQGAAPNGGANVTMNAPAPDDQIAAQLNQLFNKPGN